VLRKHEVLGSEGANITWLSLADHKTVTFERGVEAETRACGSGAVAAYMAYKKLMSNNGASMEARDFYFPGGKLQVKEEGAQYWLRGKTHIVYKGSL